MDLGAFGDFGSTGAARVKLECRIGQGGASAGGVLGAVASVLTAPENDRWATHLQAVDVVLGPAPGVDQASLRLAQSSQMPAVAVGDALTVGLGYAGAIRTVFSGQVSAVRPRSASELELLLASPARQLARLRQNASYQGQSFGDLARAWAGEASVPTHRVEAGTTFPFIAVDDRRSTWEWLANLARLSKLWVWINADGQLEAAEPEAAPSVKFQYARDVLSYELGEHEDFLGTVRVVGEGAASSQGSDAWSWLTKTSSGDANASARLYADGALRSVEAADTASASVTARADGARRRVRLCVLGHPGVGSLSRVALEGFPDQSDGEYLVWSCRHRFDKRRGYRTELCGVAA
jgi:hypothetical protein